MHSPDNPRTAPTESTCRLPDGALVFDRPDEVLDCWFKGWVCSGSCINSLARVHDRRVISSAELQSYFRR